MMTEEDVVTLYGQLVFDKAIVTFTKADGSERVMKCTLNSALIPRDDMLTNTSVFDATADIMKVYDLEALAWRSFKPSRVTSYE